jgi:rhodanese-related sulfurtransferase
MRFSSKIAAAVLLLLAAGYAAASIATGHSASSELPPDWSSKAGDAGLDVWKTIGKLTQGGFVVDVRDARDYAAYAIPGSFSMPGANAADLEAKSGYGPVVIVAAKDDAAQKLAGEAKAKFPKGEFYYLTGGVRSWYLALDLPVPMFSDAPVPHGYAESLAAVKSWVARRDPRLRDAALGGAYALARMSYEPTLLKSSSKPKAGGARKKISGGCGG